MIKIVTEKSIDSAGNRCRIVKEITGCKTRNDLPTMYLNQEHKAWSISGGIQIQNAPDLIVNSTIPEENFQRAVEELNVCGAALRTANIELDKRKKEWVGNETFCV